ncbi:MAG: hypothetical protein ACREX3_04920 [Gammaproteobacteria bacterium]
MVQLRSEERQRQIARSIWMTRKSGGGQLQVAIIVGGYIWNLLQGEAFQWVKSVSPSLARRVDALEQLAYELVLELREELR